MVQAQGCFDEPGDAGRFVEMAQVGLDRADRAELFETGAMLKGGTKSGEFNRISDGRAGPVGFNVADTICGEFAQFECFRNHTSLASGTWRGEPRFVGPIVVDCARTDHRIDAVAILLCVRKAFQHHDRSAVPTDSSVRLAVERAAMAIVER